MWKGRVWKLGDNIDTDLIIPARFLNTTNREELKDHCFQDILPGFAKRVKEGDIIVAGHNFGCGSSREHAPLAIKASGISLVIAKSFARIFYRNSLNIGLPMLEVAEDLDGLRDGDELEIDIEKGEITIPKTGERLLARPLDDFARELIKAGGLINYTRERIKGGALKP